MEKTFCKGDKVWVVFEGGSVEKGKVIQAFSDGTYLVKIRWLGLCIYEPYWLELRSKK